MHILTFDIEDWYNCDFISKDFDWDKYEVRIYEGVNRILDELDKHKLKGTFFCLGWLAEKHPGVIKEIDRRGHQIGCHSYQHQLAFRFTKEEFREDTLKAKKLLEGVINKPVKVFRAPGFSITKNNVWVFEELIDLDFEFDCSIFPSTHDYGGMSLFSEAKPKQIVLSDGRSIKELPINTKNILGRNLVFSGGGYFRLLPYWLIKRWTKQANYVMTYFHPRDFDPGQPILEKLPRMRKFKSYVGLKTSWKKFQRYLNDFDFIDIGEANKQINWNKIAKINISELING